MMMRIHGLAIAVVVATAACTCSAPAATFTTPLHFAEGTSEEGSYLSAAFDFGVRFREIESLVVQFTMPDGYEGADVSTGNSSHIRHLYGIIQDGAAPTEPDMHAGLVGSPFAGLSQSWHRIAAGEPVEIALRERRVVAPWSGNEYIFPVWPEFLYDGRGHFALVDVDTYSFRAIGIPELGSSSTSWLPLAGVHSARLTIEATPVPEPATNLLMILAGALLIASRRR